MHGRIHNQNHNRRCAIEFAILIAPVQYLLSNIRTISYVNLLNISMTANIIIGHRQIILRRIGKLVSDLANQHPVGKKHGYTIFEA